MDFKSVANQLVHETKHPLEQLELLDEKALELRDDIDAVIECRIKQLALHRLLVYLYEFPLQGLIRAEIALVEAYASGDYFLQAEEHLGRAREQSNNGLHDDAQCQRVQADIFLAEGLVNLRKLFHSSDNGHQREKPDTTWNQGLPTSKVLDEALRLTLESYGEDDVRCARIYGMKGQLARHQKNHEDALDCYKDAYVVWDALQNKHPEAPIEFLRVLLQVAESHFNMDRMDEACDYQRQAVDGLKGHRETLQRNGKDDDAITELLMDALTQLAQWLQSEGRHQDGLTRLKEAENIANACLGNEQNVFTYSWAKKKEEEDHRSNWLEQKLLDELKIPKDMWTHALQIVDQSGNQIEIFDQDGRMIDLRELEENAFPVTVKIKESSEKQKQRRKLVDIKRDIALLHLKLREYDNAIQYFNAVHYLQLSLHGSQSNIVARTLKALGTVYLAKNELDEAAGYLRRALRIFENEHPPNTSLIKDTIEKLKNISVL